LERKNPVGTASTVQTLSYISDSVRRLVNDNTDLRTLVEKERPFITRMVTERIFRGDYVHSEDLHAFLEAHGIELRASFYGVGCLLLEGYYDETDPAMIERYMVEGAIVRDAMNALLPTSSLLHQLSLNRIAFVLAIKGVEDRHEAESRFERIVEETARTLSKRDHYRFMMAGGPVVTSLTNVGVALRPALERLIDAHPVTSGYVGYWAESGNAKAYYYPQDLETKLIDIVLRGETDEVRDIVQSLMEENFRRRSLSVRLLKSFVHELEGTRTKIAEQLGVFPREDATGENAKKDSWEAEVRARLDWLVEAAQMRCPENGRRNHRLYKPLANYIESHFTEPSLSLKLIASEFGVSEVYMSTLFHELFGKTFFAYVEEKRMEHAGALLKSGKHSVKDVGKRVGFQTPAGFSRAFQRYYSVQPSKYR
jgi:AraC-like DNA-binding protein